MTLGAVALSVVTLYLDRSGAARHVVPRGWLGSSHPDVARNVLTVIAGSMIAVASTIFSITIAAVAFVSGNYGPRLLNDFMRDRGNQFSLGMFIATFVYSILILRSVRSGEGIIAGTAADPGEFTPQLSVLVAMVLVLAAVGTLVYFLHHIPASIRINSVLGGIGSQLLKAIDTRFPDPGDRTAPNRPFVGTPIHATATGYIEIIDFLTLSRIAKEEDCRFALRLRTGDFIHPNLILLDVADRDVDQALADRIRDRFATAWSRTAEQDIEYLIDELVEIALRALSPGINDPFTAITSMHWMGAAMGLLCGRNLERGPEQEDYSRDRVRPLADDPEHFLRRSFGAVRPSAASSPLASKNFLAALEAASTACANAERRRLLLEEGKELLVQARGVLHGPALQELESRHSEFRKIMEG
jgi:uncharacterized membrane protein